MRAAATQAVPPADATRISQAQSLCARICDRIWAGWSKTPFALDLLTPQAEYLIGYPRVPDGFSAIGYDETLDAQVATRPRTFPLDFEAAFPAFDEEPVIVIGAMDDVAANSPARWIVTLLHEHFHQWQDSSPEFYRDEAALGLAHGDTTGMWMLNYAFPYASAEVGAAYAKASNALADALVGRETTAFPQLLQRYLDLRNRFRELLAPDDYRYFAFQCWTEGVARYTEIRIGQLAGGAAYQADADATYARVLKRLRSGAIAVDKREVVYPFGAGEALLLDAARPDWKAHYLIKKFDLGAYF